MMDRRRTYFQQNLKTILLNSGMKYKEFAELCGISEDAVKSYFRPNASLPNPETLEKIAAQFNLHYDDLLQADFNQMMQDSLERSSYKIKFRNSMVEIGYDDVVAMIDYLQFIGYQISFYAEELRYDRTVEKGAESDFEILRQKNEALFLEKKKALNRVQDKMEQVEDAEKSAEIIEQIEEISKKYFEAEMELINIEYCLNTMNNKNKKLNVGYKIGMNRVIGMMGELGKLQTPIRKRRLKELGMYVILNLPNETDEYKKINIYDFYMMCEGINKTISERVAGA